MRVLVSIIHIIVAVLLMVTVLAQQRKQGGFSGFFGGAQADAGQWQRFTPLTKITIVLAIIFMVTSLCLALL